ncbi:cytochrome P450 [Psychrosphaera sp. B3R10]|uniref:cytochrome P450 n=1 Tax=unclassified Psychrosphaera TaxID=2641570 RepID=UPI001C07FE51|nr:MULTISPECIES: cytochrome P450 [unclassified Psychrosphaera]MBU2880763.1 cytochrome P450 [Psychrosphaera sp. I2R16]MBU2991491.1 cytochrome P450 [Psychrosphaera sp. B3R10]
MKKSEQSDPFATARVETGLGFMDDQNDPVTMVLGLKDVRKCAHNWKTYQSGAKPGRIVIPSEVNIRETRQIPFEVDPPEHKTYRDLIEPWFKRPLEADYQEQLTAIIEGVFNDVLQQPETEVVSQLALVLQSRALTLLLNTPMSDSETWINWGTHVFRSDTTALDGDKAAILYDYIEAQIERAEQSPGNDLYSLLLQSKVMGKPMTKEQIKGVMILTFAGGRDTVINMVTNTIGYFAEHPEDLHRLRDEPSIINKSVEELIRYFSPLTQMGRVATEDASICEHAVKADTRISLCWASANRDERVFENPNDVVLDRKLNPHVAFGFGTHNCLGATHARQILQTLLSVMINKLDSIAIVDSKDNIETLGEFKRKVGFDHLTVQFKQR